VEVDDYFFIGLMLGACSGILLEDLFSPSLDQTIPASGFNHRCFGLLLNGTTIELLLSLKG